MYVPSSDARAFHHPPFPPQNRPSVAQGDGASLHKANAYELSFFWEILTARLMLVFVHASAFLPNEFSNVVRMRDRACSTVRSTDEYDAREYIAGETKTGHRNSLNVIYPLFSRHDLF